MKETKLRSFMYNCSCGYMVKVYLDSSIPQEYYKCRKCGISVKRIEL